MRKRKEAPSEQSSVMMFFVAASVSAVDPPSPRTVSTRGVSGKPKRIAIAAPARQSSIVEKSDALEPSGGTRGHAVQPCPCGFPGCAKYSGGKVRPHSDITCKHQLSSGHWVEIRCIFSSRAEAGYQSVKLLDADMLDAASFQAMVEQEQPGLFRRGRCVCT